MFILSRLLHYKPKLYGQGCLNDVAIKGGNRSKEITTTIGKQAEREIKDLRGTSLGHMLLTII